MVEFLKTLAIACIPAIITGIVTYIVARKNAASQISIIKEQNKHDLEKLMEQRIQPRYGCFDMDFRLKKLSG